jgi:hypothetical protein
VNTFYLGYDNQSVMMYEAEVAVYSEINTKHIDTGVCVFVQSAQLLNVKPGGASRNQ